jgi:hypothetical protein
MTVNASTDHVLRALKTATGDRGQAEKRWRGAIRDAVASNAPIEHIAGVAGITIENLLDTIDDLNAEPSRVYPYRTAAAPRTDHHRV